MLNKKKKCRRKAISAGGSYGDKVGIQKFEQQARFLVFEEQGDWICYNKKIQIYATGQGSCKRSEINMEVWSWDQIGKISQSRIGYGVEILKPKISNDVMRLCESQA